MNVAVYNGTNAIMIHPMKTAGTSIGSFFRKQIRKRIGGDATLHQFKHLTPDEISWKFDFDEGWFKNSLCLMFVRNPYDRLVSFYHHMQQIGGHAEGVCKRKSFTEFLYNKKLTAIARPYRDYLTCNGDEIINFVGYYETLNDDVFKLIGLFGLPDIEEVKNEWRDYSHKNATRHESYQSYYTDETAKIVYESYYPDFVKFDYKPLEVV